MVKTESEGFQDLDEVQPGLPEAMQVSFEVAPPAPGLHPLWRVRRPGDPPGKRSVSLVAWCDSGRTAREHAPEYGPGVYRLCGPRGEALEVIEVEAN